MHIYAIYTRYHKGRSSFTRGTDTEVLMPNKKMVVANSYDTWH